MISSSGSPPSFNWNLKIRGAYRGESRSSGGKAIRGAPLGEAIRDAYRVDSNPHGPSGAHTGGISGHWWGNFKRRTNGGEQAIRDAYKGGKQAIRGAHRGNVGHQGRN